MSKKVKFACAICVAVSLTASVIGILFVSKPWNTDSAAKDNGIVIASGKKPHTVGTQVLGDHLPPYAIARFGTTKFRHHDKITHLSVSPQAGLAASVSSGGQQLLFPVIRLWDLATGQEVGTLTGHACEPHVTAFSPDGTLLASAAMQRPTALDDTTRVWDMRTKKQLFCFPGGRSVAFSPDGKALATSYEADVNIFDLATGKKMRQFSNGPEFSYSHDGRLVAVGSFEGKLALWRVDEWELIRSWVIPNKALISRIAISPDGANIAVFAGQTIFLWDVKSDQPRWSVKIDIFPEWLKFSPTGQELISSRQQESVCWWNCATGAEVFSAPGQLVAVSPDATAVAVLRDHQIIAYDIATHQELTHFGDAKGFPLVPFIQILCAGGLSRDGKWLVAPCYNAIQIIDAHQGEPKDQHPDYVSEVVFVEFSADGRQVLSVADNTAKFWDVQSGTEVQHFQLPGWRVTTASQSADRRFLLTNTSNYITIWDLSTGKTCHEFTSGEGATFSKVWMDKTGKYVFWGTGLVSHLQTAKKFRLPELLHSQCYCGAFAPDGKTLAGRTDGSLWVVRLDGNDGDIEFKCPFSNAYLDDQLTFSYDGRYILTNCPAPRTRAEDNDWSTLVMETASWTPIIYLLEQQTPPRAFATTSNSRFVATGGTAGIVRIWDLATGRPVATLSGHRGAVSTLAFSPDDKLLASGSTDTNILVWDVSKFTVNLPSTKAPLNVARFRQLWSELCHPDASKAFPAVWELVEAGEKTLNFLSEVIVDVTLNELRFRKLLADLNSSTFAFRQRAEEELCGFGLDARLPLLDYLKEGPALEMRKRVQRILDQIDEQKQNRAPQQLRALRAIQVLEYIGTAGASQLLEQLAKQSETFNGTRAAKVALQRLSKNPQ